jgi:DNA-binding beta-propeller fold protein YncE
MQTISGGLSYPYGIFVTITGDIYIDNGFSNGRVDKWAIDTNSSVPAMHVGSACYGLFVDINDILYCSMANLHQVVTKPLNSNSNITAIVAGIGCCGSTSNMLCDPYGIFVNINLDLYVADCGNNRIQLFQSGQLSATTVAGIRSSSTTITLNCPTGIVLDGNKYLFIVDQNNHRIVGSGPNGFRCLVGCSGSYGSASNELWLPWTLSFDSHGNMFVTDYENSRIQKFVLSSDSCGKYMKIFYLKEDFIDFLFYNMINLLKTK